MLAEALYTEHQTNTITDDDNETLGEWIAQCKTDRKAKPHDVVGCSCVVVKDCGRVSRQGCHQGVLQMQEMNK